MVLSEYTHLGTNVIKDRTIDSSVETITGDNLIAVEIDNRENTHDVYVKFYDTLDTSGSPTVGTTAPTEILKVKASDKRLHLFTGDADGLALAAALSTWYVVCVTEGGTGGTTSPTNDVIMNLVTDTPA